jgi:hypothetical protein
MKPWDEIVRLLESQLQIDRLRIFQNSEKTRFFGFLAEFEK